MSDPDLAFSPDPWVWRRLHGGRVLHAIRDADWLGGHSWEFVSSACGEWGGFPLGPRYGTGPHCRRCLKYLAKGSAT